MRIVTPWVVDMHHMDVNGRGVKFTELVHRPQAWATRFVRCANSIKCKQRFEKNRDTLFTFLRYDGVPWNNNAEHAIKAFARLRDVIAGTSSRKGVDEYLTLLS